MDHSVLLITIGERSKSKDYLSFFKENDVRLSLQTYGKGTASKETLELLKIKNNDKCVIFSVVPMQKSSVLIKELGTNMHMKRRGGYGISFTIPIHSVDSDGNTEEKEGEEGKVKTANELVIIIANNGYTEQVMEVAREAGARGGTVVHAEGVSGELAQKLLGTMIGEEKEMIFIVSNGETRNAIMRAIQEKVGVDTPCGAISFSLPVNETAGIIGN